MGERGPSRLPTPLRVLRGEKHRDRLNPGAPKPAGGFPVMPADLSPGAEKVWRRVRRQIGALGIVTVADGDVVRVYCEAVDRYQYAAARLVETGPMIRGARRGELVKNPLHQIVRDNALMIRLFARELGLTPSSREGFTGQANDEDPLAAWMASGSG